MIAGRKADRERRRAITQVVERETRQWPDQIDEIEAMAEVALKAGTQPRDFELEVLRSVRPVGPPNTPRGKSTAQQSQVIEAAVAQAIGIQDIDKHYSDEVLSAADHEFRYGIGLQQLLFRAAAAHGVHYDSAANLRGLLQAACGVNSDGAMLQAAGGFSSFSLPGILSNVLNKGLVEYFNSVEQVWSRIAATRSTNDYKTVSTYSLTGDLEYKLVPPGGEITHSELGEAEYTNRARMHGRMIAITHEDVTNDDLGALDTVRQRMGRGGALSLNTAFWTTFLDNASFFTTGTGSAVEGTDTDLAGTDPGAALNKAETSFRKQTDPDGLPLGVTPRILLVPPSLANYAAQLMGGQRIVTGASATLPDANVYAGRYAVESSNYMENASFTGNSAKAWYLLASGLDHPVIQVLFLRNRRMPLVESAEASFTELGIMVRGTFAFGVAKQSNRGGVRAKGEN
jgi:phage major head subunit gpT-like protein